LLVFLPALLLPPTAFAEDRQLLVTEGADYFGADYDVRKDVDLDQCKAACTGDQKCQAFTYNSSARWCFLKSDVGELRAVDGAISGKIVTAAAAAKKRPDVEAERIAELKFLDQTYVDEARRLVGGVMEPGSRKAGCAGARRHRGRQQASDLAALDAYRPRAFP
jgi:hypothetical protein